MNYAVVKTGGKQYRVAPGDIIEVEKLSVEPEKSFEFEEVLLVADGDNVTVGNPLVSGIKVTATVVSQIKGEKIRVSKFKAKSRYRRTTGHRQQLTQVKIDAIGNHKAQAEKSEKAEVKEESKPKTPAKTKRSSK